jgi:hypothetical protein
METRNLHWPHKSQCVESPGLRTNGHLISAKTAFVRQGNRTDELLYRTLLHLGSDLGSDNFSGDDYFDATVLLTSFSGAVVAHWVVHAKTLC